MYMSIKNIPADNSNFVNYQNRKITVEDLNNKILKVEKDDENIYVYTEFYYSYSYQDARYIYILVIMDI